MYLVSGFGQPQSLAKRPPKKGKRPPKAPPGRVTPQSDRPVDRLIFVAAGWQLAVPFREDFAAFREQFAKAVARHNAKATITTEDEQKLKAQHDELKRKSPKLKETDIVRLRADIWFTRAGDHEGGFVYLDPAMLNYFKPCPR
jgi:alkanesulfonate monooxygenase SsuD/methylene tetrahydromethanopterin reductase-like flavin-dependent oxidoreductase (luciferase family)